MADQRMLEQDLDEFVEGDDAWPEPDPAGEPIPPQDAERATRLLRRLHRLHREAAAINAVAQADLARITRWRDDRLAGVIKDVAWARAALEAFARIAIPKLPPRGGKPVKSYKLPDGTLKLVAPGKGRVVFTDKAALIAYVTEHKLDNRAKECIVVLKPEVSVEALNSRLTLGRGTETVDPETGGTVMVHELLDPDGNPVPGVCRIIPTRDRFDLSLSEEA